MHAAAEKEEKAPVLGFVDPMAELRTKQKERRNTMMAQGLTSIEEQVDELKEMRKHFTDPMEELKAKALERQGRRKTETTSIDDKVKELQASAPSQRHFSDPMAELKAKQKERRSTLALHGMKEGDLAKAIDEQQEQRKRSASTENDPLAELRQC